MADFEALGDAPPAEVDPAADFLAREQSELAGLEDDNFGVSESQTQEPQDDGLGFDMAAPAAEPAAEPEQSNGPSNAYEAISAQDTMRAEPEKIKLWREEQKARLEKKDSEEEAKKTRIARYSEKRIG